MNRNQRLQMAGAVYNLAALAGIPDDETPESLGRWSDLAPMAIRAVALGIADVGTLERIADSGDRQAAADALEAITGAIAAIDTHGRALTAALDRCTAQCKGPTTAMGRVAAMLGALDAAQDGA